MSPYLEVEKFEVNPLEHERSSRRYLPVRRNRQQMRRGTGRSRRLSTPPSAASSRGAQPYYADQGAAQPVLGSPQYVRRRWWWPPVVGPLAVEPWTGPQPSSLDALQAQVNQLQQQLQNLADDLNNKFASLSAGQSPPAPPPGE